MFTNQEEHPASPAERWRRKVARERRLENQAARP
jgi:hypothetical protein